MVDLGAGAVAVEEEEEQRTRSKKLLSWGLIFLVGAVFGSIVVAIAFLASRWK